jgi:hypothetical protein
MAPTLGDVPQYSDNLSISFSGGRTSAVMTKFIFEHLRDRYQNIIVTFANTGCEDPRTLDFIKQCDDHFDFETVWLEAEVGAEGVGIRHRIVDYETASRDGRPFEDYIRKYGIPNRELPQCTSRLKTEVMESYLKIHDWVRGAKLNYDTAIGIRSDEWDRLSINAEKNRFVYPLAYMRVTMEMVKKECLSWPFDLQLPGDHWGNCQWCWKKSKRKLMTLVLEDESIFTFPKKMDEKYSQVKAAAGKTGVRRFFRGDITTNELIQEAKSTEFEPYSDKEIDFDDVLDVPDGSCSESCEVYGDYE